MCIVCPHASPRQYQLKDCMFRLELHDGAITLWKLDKNGKNDFCLSNSKHKEHAEEAFQKALNNWLLSPYL